MKLKRQQDVDWFDLPKVESPFFAKSLLESTLSTSCSDLTMFPGLSDAVWNDYSHAQPVWDNNTLTCLLGRVERGEVLLVHGPGTEPIAPIVHGEVEQGSHDWVLNEGFGHVAQLNLDWVVKHAYKSRTIWAPIPLPAEAPKVEIKKEEKEEPSITNPRWEHVDENRKNNSADTTVVGDVVNLMVDVTGVKDGSRVTFKIFDTSISPPARVGVARGDVEGGIGRGEWKVKPLSQGSHLEFEGEVRRMTSERAEIPVEELVFILSF